MTSTSFRFNEIAVSMHSADPIDESNLRNTIEQVRSLALFHLNARSKNNEKDKVDMLFNNINIYLSIYRIYHISICSN